MVDPDEIGDEGESGRGHRYMLEVAASTVGAIAGLGVGGPIGAIAGAAIPPSLVSIVDHFGAQWREARLRTTVEALETAGEEMGRPAAEVLNAADTPAKALFAGRTLNAAGMTVHRGKVRTLGRLLAMGLLEDDQAILSEVELLGAALTEVEAPHLRVLTRFDTKIAYFSRAPHDWEYHGHMLAAYTMDGLSKELPTFGAGLHALVATLQRHGLIEKQDVDLKAFYEEIGRSLAGHGSSISMLDLDPGWKLTPLGLRLLQMLHEAGDEA